MTHQHPTASEPDEGHEDSDVDEVVKAKPTLDVDGELNDSADSYVSPARTDGGGTR